MPPFEIQVFVAVEHVVRAVGVARVESAATSEPASGSDSAKAAIASPVAHAPQVAALRASAPERARRAAAQALHGEREVGKPEW